MKAKIVFYCTNCGNETPKWQGQCSACGSWNTIVEETFSAKKKPAGIISNPNRSSVVTLAEINANEEIRFDTGLSELDRVLGGGAVKGSLVLVGGAPGIGKSTLLLQVCGYLGKSARILYVSGEESGRQLKMRAGRLRVPGDALFILTETELEAVTETVQRVRPDILIIDSIQTLYNSELTAAPGSVSQVKACTMALMQLAKGEGSTVFVVGHVNKDGDIAGPKVLEHMVDCVLYFEGDRSMPYRILRAAKNRFGSTNEIGVFEMTGEGLNQVENPSSLLLSGRPEKVPGSCVTCVMEGTRPVLAEIQALVTPSSFHMPRRTASGFDFNRAMLLLAVLEKRGGLSVGGCDAYINVIGGLTLDEPAADLAAMLSISSSYRDIPIVSSLVAIGEVGLTGEIRAVQSINQRLSEVWRIGFQKCIVPEQNCENINKPDGLKLIPVRSIRDALQAALEK